MRRFRGLFAWLRFAGLRMDVVSATVEYMRLGSLFVPLGMASACFSGFLT